MLDGRRGGGIGFGKGDGEALQEGLGVQEGVGDACGEGFNEVRGRAFDDVLNGLDDMSVVDGVREVVGGGGGADVEVEIEGDAVGLSVVLFVGGDAVMSVGADPVDAEFISMRG